MKTEKQYLSSKEKKEQLKISACELMHLREAGNLKFIKSGKSYLYAKI